MCQVLCKCSGVAPLREPLISQMRKLRLVTTQEVVSLCQLVDPGLSDPQAWDFHHDSGLCLQCGWTEESGNLSPKSEHSEIQLCDHRDFVGFTVC